MFFKEVIHYCGTELMLFSKDLKLNNDLSEKIWKLVEYILSHQTKILINVHLDIIVICSIYIVLKVYNIKPTFKDIILIYQNIPSHNAKRCEEIVLNIQLNKTTIIDITKFYNDIFLNAARNFVVQFQTNEVNPSI